MDDQSWENLCSSIFQGNCILFIGSEFPIEYRNQITQSKKSTSNHDIIVETLSPIVNKYSHDYDDLTSLGTRFFAGHQYQELHSLLAGELEPISKFDSPVFRKLIELKFPLTIDTNYTRLFYEITKENQYAESRSFHYTRPADNPDKIKNNKNSGNFCDFFTPFVYRLFGDLNDQGSLVLSETHLIDLLVKIVSRDTPLPIDLHNMLKEPNKCFLFIGFGFVDKDWYFRILLSIFGAFSKNLKSYVVQCGPSSPSYGKFTSINLPPNYFSNTLNTLVFDDHIASFVDNLRRKFEAYQAKMTENGNFRYAAGPKCFISYKREDSTVVEAICERLRAEGIVAWFDKKDLHGVYDPRIKHEIEETDCYLLMQSVNMKQADAGRYVFKEIDRCLAARDLAAGNIDNDDLRVLEDFFIPCLLDGTDNDLSDRYPFIKDLQNYSLVRDGKVDDKEIKKLAKLIRDTYSSNKRRNRP